MGSILVAGRLIHDWHPFGVLSVEDVLAHSSDVGSIKIALRLGAPKFYETIRAFGVGQLTGIELPGENRGLLRPVENWTASSIGSIAIGQEVSATPVQIASAISAVANGGTLYRARIVKEVTGGTTPYTRAAVEPEQVTDAKTAATVREMMETVILEGTGKPARLDGWTAAGKSGTAQKIDPSTGRYSPNQYNSSFVGFAPVNEPAVTILVVLDSPVGAHHGGEVGGPVFKRIAEQVLAYLDVPRDVPLAPEVQTAAKSERVAPADMAKEYERARYRAAVADKVDVDMGVAAKDSKPGPPTIAFAEQEAVVVPNLAGQTVRGVTEACSRLGLVPALIGSGVALEQSVEAGTQVLRGSRLAVRFGRVGEFVQTASKGAGN
jgi:cell division protein FtsI (penicillin-binding protein 3)